MKAYSFIFGYFCINAAIWTVSTVQLFAITREPIIDPTNIASLFSLDVFTVITGIVGGGVIGVLAMLTKSYALSTGILIVWIMGILLKPIRDVFVGLPLLVNSLLSEAPVIATIISQVVTAFGALMFFMFVVEVVLGRDLVG